MKKQELFDLLYQLASPIGMILAGLVLALCPDLASAVISRVLGWCVTLVAICFGIGAILDRPKAVRRGIISVALAILGGTLTAKPLLLAAFVGKIIGLFIALRGVRELFLARSRGCGKVPGLFLTVAGVLLVVLPMTASRLVFSICGWVILVAGVLMLLNKIRERRLPPGRPDIIDAL